jgi:hypothetical protein
MTFKRFNPIQECAENWKPLAAISALGFGPHVIGAMLFHDGAATISFSTSTQPIVRKIVVESNVFTSALLIFVHNLSAACVEFLLPSLFIPFVGLYRLMCVSYVDGCTNGLQRYIRAPGAILITVMEYSAYILLFLAIYVLWTRLVFPRWYAIQSRKEGLFAGVRSATKILALVPVILFVSAFFESSYIIHSLQASAPPFPKTFSTFSWLDSKGASVRLPLSDWAVYYDSLTIDKSDAKVAGVALEDVGYFGPSMLSGRGSIFTMEINLESKLWKDPKVVRSLSAVQSRLNNAYHGRHYEIVATSFDSSGRKDTTLIQ